MNPRLPSSDAEVARMQSELDRWQAERTRLRSILHNQQNRQSALEEQNFRLREQRSRLQEEHNRLHEQSSRQQQRYSEPYQSHSLRQSPNISTLASVINDVGNDSYATTGAGPSRQRLYDWAARHPASDREDFSRYVHGVQSVDPQAVDSTPTELERALRNYRMARSALRSGRPPSSDLSVPTASALRAYWSEEPNEHPMHDRPDNSTSTSTYRQPFALSEFVEQHRLERQRRHLDIIRRQNEAAQAQAQAQAAHQPRPLPNPHTPTDAFVRVRTTIKYLSALRHTSTKQSLTLARSFGLDSLHQHDATSVPSYLPLHIDTMPIPQPSSWLTPGMTWHGLQSTDREPVRAPVLTRRQRQENLGVFMARSRLAENRSLLSSFTPDADSDRFSSLVSDSEGRWGFGGDGGNGEEEMIYNLNPHYMQLQMEQERQSQLQTQRYNESQPPAQQEVDHWPVTVTLHSVDFEGMTASGTMRASQLPEMVVAGPNNDTPNNSNNASGSDEVDAKQPKSLAMESYFHGEIIDFRTHTLETTGTPQSSTPYKSGGVDVDARYWARLGPFKCEIDKALSYSSVSGSGNGSGGSGGNGRVWDIKLDKGAKYLDENMVGSAMARSEPGSATWREEEADEVMARCLGDGRWLEKHLGRDGGEWVLMRWKGESHFRLR
jgi:hypothetical protein